MSSSTTSGARRRRLRAPRPVAGLADDLERIELEQLAGGRPETGVVVDDYEGAHLSIISPGTGPRLGENPEIKTEDRSDVLAARAPYVRR